MDENDVQRVYIHRVYQRDSKITTDKGFVNIDNGSMGGSHGVVSYKKGNKSYYFESLAGQPDKFPLNQLQEPIYYNYKIRDIYSKLCGSYCLYFFCLIETME